MKIRLNEDYYSWCCDWCDSENRVLWARMEYGISCGACHRPMTITIEQQNANVENNTISAGLY